MTAVADISLADYGRKDIELAEVEMPGLMACREEYGPAAPLEGCSHLWIPSHDHPDRRPD